MLPSDFRREDARRSGLTGSRWFAFVVVLGAAVLLHRRRRRRRLDLPFIRTDAVAGGDADGAGLFVDRRGEGPDVVLVHGLGASSRYWDDIVEALGGRVRTHAVDLLGFGRSPKPGTAAYDVACHTDALAAAVPRGSVVVTHSTGGMIALHLAATRPDLVAALVLVGLPAHPDPATARREIAALGTFARLTAERRPSARILCEAMCALRPLASLGAPVILRDVPAHVATDGALHTWPSYSRTLEAVVIGHRVDADVRAVSAPIHLLTGSEDDVAPGRYLERIRSEGSGNIRVVIVEGEDHQLALHRPDLVVESVRAALAAVEPLREE